eukprot:CAMPEP_0172755314 /NCGR_PEP_ID=MMETSP1074-20121228/159625_1 /TAXON_ID=2916 /ORGANISM="Ceratium fusus, Strain PA161109" /LENGTH=83 /DNA_ID=CAMNT_0013588383 /DNA_START=42 /DNA_END=293 /DNA_ORIENTATION=+
MISPDPGLKRLSANAGSLVRASNLRLPSNDTNPKCATHPGCQHGDLKICGGTTDQEVALFLRRRRQGSVVHVPWKPGTGAFVE